MFTLGGLGEIAKSFQHNPEEITIKLYKEGNNKPELKSSVQAVQI